MNVLGLLQEAIQFIKRSFPDFDVTGMVSKALGLSKDQTNASSVMSYLESMVRGKDCSQAFVNNQVWESVKNKNLNDIAPYVLKTAKEMGFMNVISSFMGK